MLQPTGRIKAQLLSVVPTQQRRHKKQIGHAENLTFESIDAMRQYAEENNKVIVYWWYEMGVI